MTYTRQDVLDHYNKARGTNFTLVQLGTVLLTQKLQEELSAMLDADAAAAKAAALAGL